MQKKATKTSQRHDGRKYTVEKMKEEILKKLKDLGTRIYETLEKDEFPEIQLPARTTSNIVYDANLRQYVLGPRTTERSVRNIRHLRPFSQLMWMATFAKELISTRKTSTLRDAFYNALGFGIDFEDQQESDTTITEIETIVRQPREDLNIFPEERSSVFGPLTIEYTVPGYEGRRLELTSIPDGAMIGPAMTTANFVKSGAEMVLVVEKGAVYQRFLEEKAHKKFKALIVHTAGQPPRATRRFIRRLNRELDLPVYLFTDGDPWGMHIASVVIYGSALSAHITELNTPEAVWAGVWASDIPRYKLPAMRLNEEDLRRLKELENDPRYAEPLWKREIQMFSKLQRKCELEAFSRFSLPYIVEEFLPERLAELTKR